MIRKVFVLLLAPLPVSHAQSDRSALIAAENAIEIDTELELMGYTFDLKMVQRSTESYSDFGRTVEISVPRD